MMANGEVIIDVGLDESEVTKGLKNLKSSFTKIGGAVTALGAAMGVAGVAAIGGLVEATAELNTDLARLKANAETAGFGFEQMTEGMSKVAAVSGELDSAVETMSNLMATDFSENQLAEALDYVNAGAIRFSDTLKTEGIADGLQETFATGKAVGQFGELLERSGVDLDKFNVGLATATKNGTETDYVLQQLAATGLKDTYDQYLESNKAIVEYNQAQVDSQLKTAQLGEKLTPLVTNFINLKNTLLDVALGNKTLSQAFVEVSTQFNEFVRTAADKGKKVLPEFVKSIVDKIPELLSTGLKMVTELGKSIETNLPILVAKGKVMVDKLSTKIIESLPEILRAGVELVKGLVNGITQSLPQVVSITLNMVKTLISTIIKNLPSIINMGIELVVAIVSGLLKAIPKVISFVTTDFIPSIVKTIMKQDWGKVGSDIIAGLVKGLKSVASSAITAVTDIAKNMIDGAKSVLGIHSPSRVFKEIGLWTGEGLEIGLNDSSKNVNNAMLGILDGIMDVSKSYQKEYEQYIKDSGNKNSKAQDAALKKIASIESAAAKKKRSLTSSELKEIEKLRVQANNTQVSNKAAHDKKYKAMVEAAEKDYLEVVKRYIEDKKSLDELTLLEESRVWEQSIEMFVVGSAQRVAAQKEYQKSLEAINKQINEVNSNYQKQALDLDKSYLDQTKALNKEYDDAWKSRYNSLSSFAGTFEGFTLEFGVQSETLIENLREQEWALRNWDEYLDKVSVKGLNESIIKELKELGPKALPNLVALNQMTDEQLTEYNNLYEEKHRRITKQVDEELSLMKRNTEAQLRAVKTIHEGELKALQDSWDAAIKGLVTKTANNFTSLKQVGQNAGQNLLDGLKQMESPLNEQAKRMADSIKKTMENALDIKVQSNNSKSSAYITNPLKNAKIGLGTLVTPSQNVINNIANSSGDDDISVNIAPAPIYLDGKKIADATFERVSSNEYRSASISAYVQGVNLL